MHLVRLTITGSTRQPTGSDGRQAHLCRILQTFRAKSSDLFRRVAPTALSGSDDVPNGLAGRRLDLLRAGELSPSLHQLLGGSHRVKAGPPTTFNEPSDGAAGVAVMDRLSGLQPGSRIRVATVDRVHTLVPEPPKSLERPAIVGAERTRGVRDGLC